MMLMTMDLSIDRRGNVHVFKLDVTEQSWCHLSQMPTPSCKEFMEDGCFYRMSCVGVIEKIFIKTIEGLKKIIIFDTCRCVWHSIEVPESVVIHNMRNPSDTRYYKGHSSTPSFVAHP